LTPESGEAPPRAFLPMYENIPPLEQWRRCDAFREASTKIDYKDKLDEIFNHSFYHAGLPYALAVIQLATNCGFAVQMFNARTWNDEIGKTLDSVGKPIWNIQSRKLATILPDMNEVAQEIEKKINEKVPKDEILRYIFAEAKARAQSMVKGLLHSRGDVHPLNGNVTGNDSQVDELSAHHTAEPVSSQRHPEEDHHQLDFGQITAEPLALATEVANEVTAIAPLVEEDAAPQAHHQFNFDDASSNSNYCEILAERDPAQYVQSMLVSYGLGYAFLVAHRLDQCDQSSHLVQDLHNDLYQWLNSQDFELSGPLESLSGVFTALKLPQPGAREERFWLAKSVIGRVALLEKWSIEQVLSMIG